MEATTFSYKFDNISDLDSFCDYFESIIDSYNRVTLSCCTTELIPVSEYEAWASTTLEEA